MKLGLSLSLATSGYTSAASIWLPTVTSGLDLVLHAGERISLESGSVVSAWGDGSGAGNNYAAASLRPAYQAAGGPGGTRPALYFTGTTTGDARRLTGPGFTGAAREIFIIAKKDTQSTQNHGGICRFGSATDAEHFPFSDGGHYGTFGTTARKATGLSPGTMTSWFLANWISAAGEWTTRLNRVQVYTTATNTVGWHTSSTLGVDLLGGVSWLIGHIAGVIMYDHKLTAPERTQVEADILAEFGV